MGKEFILCSLFWLMQNPKSLFCSKKEQFLLKQNVCGDDENLVNQPYS